MSAEADCAEIGLKKRALLVRQFNRFYTKQIGVLNEAILGSSFSLAEARLLYELAHQEKPIASQLTKDLDLDPGYLSRLIGSFEKRGYVKKSPLKNDGRQSLLSLTAKGQKVFATLDARSTEEICALLSRLTVVEQDRLVGSMETIESALGDKPDAKEPYIIRTHRPGDMGWVVHRHGLLYAHEFGWNEQFEALVAEIVAKFVREFDPNLERCWIAEHAGEIVGSVFLVKHSEQVAKLRLLLVEPQARGLGLGTRLVYECIQFARLTRYKKITLWTNDVLVSARRIYERAGFRLIEEQPHHSFGHDLMGQTWELDL